MMNKAQEILNQFPKPSEDPSFYEAKRLLRKLPGVMMVELVVKKCTLVCKDGTVSFSY